MFEMLCCLVVGYEFEEFIYGIYNVFDECFILIMFDLFFDECQDCLVEIFGGWIQYIYCIGL